MKCKAAITFIFIALIGQADLAHASGSSIYVIERADGSVTFTSRKPSSGNFKVFSPGQANYSYARSRASSWKSSFNSNSKKFNQFIETQAHRFGVDPWLVKAVVHVESGFNPRARSHKGAMGLMQLMPDTARSLGVRDPYHPEQNIVGGIKYLRDLLSKYKGNLGLTLAAYNAGEFAVEKHGGIPPFRETINYVRKVVELRNVYKLNRG